jgi:hypothetical protein
MKQVRDGILEIFMSNYLKWEKMTNTQSKLADREQYRQVNVAKDHLKRENIQKIKVYRFINR